MLVFCTVFSAVCDYIKPSVCLMLSWQLAMFCSNMVLVSWCRCTLTTAVLNESWNLWIFLNTERDLILLTISFFNSCEMGFRVGGIPFRIICQAYSSTLHEACPCGSNQFDQSDHKKVSNCSNNHSLKQNPDFQYGGWKRGLSPEGC